MAVTTADWNIEQKEGTYTATFHTENNGEVTSTVEVANKPADPVSLVAASLTKTGDAYYWILLAFLVAGSGAYAVASASKRRRLESEGSQAEQGQF